MGYYYLYKDTANLWRWRYVASNGKTIAVSSESYYNKSDALNGIGIMKASYNAPVREP
jgi:uncharacterized protein YegP (UPF0339 family)